MIKIMDHVVPCRGGLRPSRGDSILGKTLLSVATRPPLADPDRLLLRICGEPVT